MKHFSEKCPYLQQGTENGQSRFSGTVFFQGNSKKYLYVFFTFLSWTSLNTHICIVEVHEAPSIHAQVATKEQKTLKLLLHSIMFTNNKLKKCLLETLLQSLIPLFIVLLYGYTI